ncbi:MAG: DNA polymerase I, partial [Firmicutes bacterium]|nr:DNA polymerase I [Bacillota bacterium]
MTKLAAIDGNSLINRAFYAMPPLTNSKGQFTNAVYGFTTMLIRLIADLQPQHIAVAFDLPGKTFRHTLYEGYKATRKGMPDELAEQVPLLKELLRVMGICIVEREGLEADDMLGALAAQYSGKTYIITGDRDALQLIDERTVVLLTRRGITDTDEVTAQNIQEK